MQPAWNKLMMSAVVAAIAAAPASAQGSFADVNGVRLYYEVQGAGPALVLIHGWAINSDYWDDQVPAFRARYRVIRYDRRGFGRSSGDPDLTADPVDLAALLDHLAVERAYVLGHSQGSASALAFAVHCPGRVAALVLSGAGGVSDYAGDGAERRQEGFAERRRIARTQGLDSVFALVGRGPGQSRDTLTPEQRARSARMLALYRATDLLTDTRPSGQARRVVQADLPGLRVPTLLLIGERETDNVLDRTADLARRLPNARRVVLPGGGHLINLSRIEAYNAAVMSFLAEVGRGSGF